MTKELLPRLRRLGACAAVSTIIVACSDSQSGLQPAPTTSGGSPSTAACLPCAQASCPSQANNCSATPGCAELATCLLGCGISGSACSAQCANANTNPNASAPAALYAACALTACPSPCTPALGVGGSGGQVGVGGGPNNGGQNTTGGTTPANTNLILDPDFNAVSAYWSATANSGEAANLACSGGQCCVTNEYSTWFAFSLGYPRSSLQAFTVQGGASYTLSFRARGSAVNSLEVKIGKAIDPYTTIYSSLVTVSSSLNQYTLQFTPAATDTTAGLVFNAELADYGSICFASVSLMKSQ